MVRKLSSEKAISGIAIDEIPVGKFARRNGMSFMQLQQQTREKCQEIWDRQVESLSAVNHVENGSDTEANSDLDSFAGDLENLLDAEEFDDEDRLGNDKAEGMRRLIMRRCPTRAQVNGEIEDDVEVSLAKKLLEGGYFFFYVFLNKDYLSAYLLLIYHVTDDGNDTKWKKQPVDIRNYGTSIYDRGSIKSKQIETGKMIKSSAHSAALTTKGTATEVKEVVLRQKFATYVSCLSVTFICCCTGRNKF
jgi:transcription initiation factor TFIID subunit 1